MSDLDRTAHQDAALVEKAASAASCLGELAQALSARVAAFRLPA